MDLGLNLSTKRTRKREFLDEMTRVVPWRKLIALIEPHYPKGKTGRPPFPIATMLRIHFLQQWFSSRTRLWRRRCMTFRCTGSSRCWTLA
jgi:transposase, IS5 family